MTPYFASIPGEAHVQGLPVVGGVVLPQSEAESLAFVAEMYGLQFDQIAALLASRGEPADRAGDSARELVARWRSAGLADTGQLSVGEPWIWATRKALQSFGLRTSQIKPGQQTLRHVHAVTEVRMAVEQTTSFRERGGVWRTERTILSELELRSEHVPDGEVHWPAGNGSPWAGETWAVEIEISQKTVERTAGIMQEILTRTGGWSRHPASNPAPGAAPRYARLVYACAPRAVTTVMSGRAEVGSPLSARIDIYDLPESALRLNTPKRGWEA